MSGAKEQVTRLLALAPYLQAHRSVRLQELADAFGVSTAQMIKDLNVLYYCGLPGQAGGQLMEINFEAFENDPQGVVNLENADYLTRPLRLGSNEAVALLVALKALREGSNQESAAVIDSALTKIEDATSTGAGDAVHVQLPPRSADQDSFRAALQESITKKTQAGIDYYVPSRDESTQRVVDPIALFTKDGAEYLDAWCHQAGGRRTFRLSRIRAVRPSDEPDHRTRHDAARPGGRSLRGRARRPDRDLVGRPGEPLDRRLLPGGAHRGGRGRRPGRHAQGR